MARKIQMKHQTENLQEELRTTAAELIAMGAERDSLREELTAAKAEIAKLTERNDALNEENELDTGEARVKVLSEAIEKVKEGYRAAPMASDDYEYDFARNMGIADAIGKLEGMIIIQEVGNGK